MNRRTLLTAAGPIALAAAIPATAALAPEPVPFAHPDAALLDAWDRYRTATIALAQVARWNGDDPRVTAMNHEADAALDVIRDMPATTPAGAAVKARRLFASYGSTIDAEDAAFGRGAPSVECLRDERAFVLWGLIQNLEAMAAA